MKWVKVCPRCLSPQIKPVVIQPVYVDIALSNEYACSECGEVMQPIEVDAAKLAGIKKR